MQFEVSAKEQLLYYHLNLRKLAGIFHRQFARIHMLPPIDFILPEYLQLA